MKKQEFTASRTISPSYLKYNYRSRWSHAPTPLCILCRDRLANVSFKIAKNKINTCTVYWFNFRHPISVKQDFLQLQSKLDIFNIEFLLSPITPMWNRLYWWNKTGLPTLTFSSMVSCIFIYFHLFPNRSVKIGCGVKKMNNFKPLLHAKWEPRHPGWTLPVVCDDVRPVVTYPPPEALKEAPP